MKKKLFLITLILSMVSLASGCGKKTEQNEAVPTVQNQTMEQQQIAGEEPEKKQSNTLDYMAPGYNQAQNKIKQVQELRQQAIDENNEDIENVEY